MAFDSAFWRDLEAQFRALPDASRLTAGFCDGRWLVYDGPTDARERERLHKLFVALARRGAMATGIPKRANALDGWLDRLREESPYFHAIYGGPQQNEKRDEQGHIENLVLASAEYCVELATRALELEASADGGTVAGLRRDRYPFCTWLDDHSHEPLADLEAEFDYLKTHVWRGYNALMEEYEQLGIATWADRLQKLNLAVAGLSYDLAVLHVNRLIDRGLRGEEALSAYQDECTELQEQLAASWRGWCERLAISCPDGSAEPDWAKPFLRVADDFRQLLGDLPPLLTPNERVDLGANRKGFVLPILAAKGWSTQDWAIESHVDFHTANDYLNGTTKPYRSTRKKLAVSLGVPVEAMPE